MSNKRSSLAKAWYIFGWLSLIIGGLMSIGKIYFFIDNLTDLHQYNLDMGVINYLRYFADIGTTIIITVLLTVICFTASNSRGKFYPKLMAISNHSSSSAAVWYKLLGWIFIIIGLGVEIYKISFFVDIAMRYYRISDSPDNYFYFAALSYIFGIAIITGVFTLLCFTISNSIKNRTQLQNG
jgi:hypothetical protein